METLQSILEESPFWETLNPLEQFNLIIETGKIMKSKKIVEVQIKNGRGRFAKIWEGTCLDTAKKIKNNFRIQGGKARAVIFVRA